MTSGAAPMFAGLGDLGRHADAVGELIERATSTIPYYADHLAGATRRPFHELATSSKADLVGRGPRPLAAPGVRLHRCCATSGTTGPRLLVGFSEADWERLATTLGRRGAAVGVGRDDLLANTHGYGLWIGGPALELLAMRAGAGVVPLGPGHTDQLLTWLSELPITLMSATPSFVRYLAERVARDGVDTSAWRLRMGLIGGEGASVELRRTASAAFGAGFRWQELYGSTEVGGPIVAWSAPDDPFSGQLVLGTDELVVELLHLERDEPVAPGELGELTVTTPHRESDPLIRYRTRDLTVSLGDDLAGHPVVRSIVGRIDDALKVRGSLVYPGALETIVVACCPDGAEWRIVLDREPGALDTLTLVVEHDLPDAGGLADRVSDTLGVRALVEVVRPGSLDRFEAKASRVVDRR